MLRTRLIVGAMLAALTVGMLLVDQRFAPWFPFLFGTMAFLSVVGTLELLALLPEATRPNRVLALAGVLALIVLAWGKIIGIRYSLKFSAGLEMNAATWVFHGFAALILIAFVFEMATFRSGGHALIRLALTIWLFAYLGLLPTFLAMLRTNLNEWTADAIHRGTAMLALAIFVPKACDIGAYFTGRALGRHKMAPALSPGKTWEGAAGGLIAAVAAAFGIDALGAVIPGSGFQIAAFGLTVGGAGMLGDLAESMIKRDCERKDASDNVPGFGGVLDVVDSILFAAPAAYWWLA